MDDLHVDIDIPPFDFLPGGATVGATAAVAGGATANANASGGVTITATGVATASRRAATPEGA